MIILASFLPLTFFQVEPLINMGTEKDHAMFRQEGLLGFSFPKQGSPNFQGVWKPI